MADERSLSKSPDLTLDDLRNLYIQLRQEYDAHNHDGLSSRGFNELTADTIIGRVLSMRKNTFASVKNGFWMGIDPITNTFKINFGDEQNYVSFDGETLRATNINLTEIGTAGESFTGTTMPQPVFIGDETTETVRVNPNITANSFSMNLTKKMAFRYIPSENVTVNQIEFRAERQPAMQSAIKISIQTNSGSAPSGVELGSVEVPHTLISESGSPASTTSDVFSSNVELSSGTSYWVVFEMVDTTMTEYLYIQHSGSGSDTVGTYDGASWTIDTTADLSVSILCKFNGGQLFKSDASVSSRAKFHGFVVNTVQAGSTLAKLVFSGFIQAGILVAGSKYYVSDTRGVIDVSAGTTSVEVGTAFSTTKLLIKAY